MEASIVPYLLSVTRLIAAGKQLKNHEKNPGDISELNSRR